MSVQEIKAAISELPAHEVAQLMLWLTEYQSDLWDKQIEQDALFGRLSLLAEQANHEFEASRCQPL